MVLVLLTISDRKTRSDGQFEYDREMAVNMVLAMEEKFEIVCDSLVCTVTKALGGNATCSKNEAASAADDTIFNFWSFGMRIWREQ